MVITLNTTSFKHGTFGILKADSFECVTVERPWLQNKRSISCIPAGEYVLRKRKSGVVSRTSRGKFLEGWEVVDVPDRTYIMLHIANKVSNVIGCIGVGRSFGVIGQSWAVMSSAIAFEELMDALSGEEEHTLMVRRRVLQGV